MDSILTYLITVGIHCLSTVSINEFESCLEILVPELLMAPAALARCFINLCDWSETRW